MGELFVALRSDRGRKCSRSCVMLPLLALEATPEGPQLVLELVAGAQECGLLATEEVELVVGRRPLSH
jgi:hypothetical protein